MQVKAVPSSGTLLLLLFFWEGSFPRYWHDSLPCFICISGQISSHGGQHPIWLPQSLLLVFAPCVIPSLGVCPGPLTHYWGIEHSKNEGCPFLDWLWNIVTSILLTPSLPLWLFSLVHCDEASCHVLSQPVERPMWQGTQRKFQQTALEKPRPSEDSLWDTNSCQQHVCLEADPSLFEPSGNWSSGWHLDYSLWETPRQRMPLSCFWMPVLLKPWVNKYCG